MKTSRRNMLRGAAITSVAASAGALSACQGESNNASPQERSYEADKNITKRTIAEAEKLQGIEYTDAERQQMLEDLQGKLENIAALHAADFPNTLAPALLFDPKLPGKSVGSQKNILEVTPVNKSAPDANADLAFGSVTEQAKWLRDGAITSVQLTELYLDRIAKYDSELHAYITVTPEIARAQAAKADKDFAEGRDRGPLQGIPYGLKDLADTKGVRTTWGATPFKERVPDSDAEVVRKLQRAGAVMLGKTSCGAIAYGDQWFDARTKNPWNTKEGSSGSSAGSGSAVAAGLCSFGIGTETLGSIVSPSERCGVTGLRPTFGRVSRHGFMALCWSLDKVGPICRSVEDTAAVLSKINGYDADDPSTARVGFTYESNIDVSDMRVGYVPEWFENGDSVDRSALEAARALGVELIEFPWPNVDFRSLIEIVLVESAAAFSELTLTDRDDELVWQDKEAWPNTWRAARFMSAVDYVQIDRLRRKLMEEMRTAFDGFDALIGPHYAGGVLLATNMTGHPQLALRAGFGQKANRTLFDNETAEGAETFRVPRGISLWGDLFQEGKIVALGRALEKELGVANERPPGFD